MQPTALTTPSPRTSPANIRRIAGAATTGAMWTVGLSSANKVLTLVCQLGLSWLLSPADFGLIGMAMSATVVASLFSGMQFKAVLFKNLEEFDHNLPQVFWLSALFGLFGAALLAALAPMIAGWLGHRTLLPLIFILAAAHFFNSLPSSHAAILSRDLRFRAVAWLQFGIGAINNLGALALAALGLGPFAVLLAILCSSIFSCLVQWRLAGGVRFEKPDLHRWMSFLAPVFLLMLTSAFTALGTCGANLIIGSRYSATVAGYFYWAFAVSFQATFLLVTSLREVMFPALAHLNHDLPSQSNAVTKSATTLLATTIPICVLQVLLARPAITLLFGPKWIPAIPFVQILSLGVLFQPLSMVANALFTARGEFKALLLTSAGGVGVTLLAGWAAAFTGSPFHVALAIGLSSSAACLFSGCYALRLLRQPVRVLFKTSCVPVALGALALLLGIVVINKVSANSVQIVLCAVAVMVFGYGGALLWVPDFRVVAARYLPALRRVEATPV